MDADLTEAEYADLDPVAQDVYKATGKRLTDTELRSLKLIAQTIPLPIIIRAMMGKLPSPTITPKTVWRFRDESLRRPK